MAANPSHPGRHHVVSFLDSFQHVGSDESHICIVFEPLGENLLALIQRNSVKGVPRSFVKAIAKQMLLGLQYLHEECDLVHTDIKPENISQFSFSFSLSHAREVCLTSLISGVHPRCGGAHCSRTIHLTLSQESACWRTARQDSARNVDTKEEP